MIQVGKILLPEIPGSTMGFVRQVLRGDSSPFTQLTERTCGYTSCLLLKAPSSGQILTIARMVRRRRGRCQALHSRPAGPECQVGKGLCFRRADALGGHRLYPSISASG